jgi:hypothetical protein
MVPGIEVGRAGIYTLHRAAYSADTTAEARKRDKNGPLYVAMLAGKIISVMCSKYVWTHHLHRNKGLGAELWIVRTVDPGVGIEVVMVAGKPGVIRKLSAAELEKFQNQSISPQALKLLWRAYELLVERGIITPYGQGPRETQTQGEASEETPSREAGGSA